MQNHNLYQVSKTKNAYNFKKPENPVDYFNLSDFSDSDETLLITANPAPFAESLRENPKILTDSQKEKIRVVITYWAHTILSNVFKKYTFQKDKDYRLLPTSLISVFEFGDDVNMHLHIGITFKKNTDFNITTNSLKFLACFIQKGFNSFIQKTFAEYGVIECKNLQCDPNKGKGAGYHWIHLYNYLLKCARNNPLVTTLCTVIQLDNSSRSRAIESAFDQYLQGIPVKILVEDGEYETQITLSPQMSRSTSSNKPASISNNPSELMDIEKENIEDEDIRSAPRKLIKVSKEESIKKPFTDITNGEVYLNQPVFKCQNVRRMDFNEYIDKLTEFVEDHKIKFTKEMDAKEYLRKCDIRSCWLHDKEFEKLMAVVRCWNIAKVGYDREALIRKFLYISQEKDLGDIKYFKLFKKFLRKKNEQEYLKIEKFFEARPGLIAYLRHVYQHEYNYFPHREATQNHLLYFFGQTKTGKTTFARIISYPLVTYHMHMDERTGFTDAKDSDSVPFLPGAFHVFWIEEAKPGDMNKIMNCMDYGRIQVKNEAGRNWGKDDDKNNYHYPGIVTSNYTPSNLSRIKNHFNDAFTKRFVLVNFDEECPILGGDNMFGLTAKDMARFIWAWIWHAPIQSKWSKIPKLEEIPDMGMLMDDFELSQSIPLPDGPKIIDMTEVAQEHDVCADIAKRSLEKYTNFANKGSLLYNLMKEYKVPEEIVVKREPIELKILPYYDLKIYNHPFNGQYKHYTEELYNFIEGDVDLIKCGCDERTLIEKFSCFQGRPFLLLRAIATKLCEEHEKTWVCDHVCDHLEEDGINFFSGNWLNLIQIAENENLFIDEFQDAVTVPTNHQSFFKCYTKNADIIVLDD